MFKLYFNGDKVQEYLLAKVSAKQDKKKAKKMLLRSVKEFSGTTVLLLWDPMCHTYLIGLPLQLLSLPYSVYSALRSSAESRFLHFSLVPATLPLP